METLNEPLMAALLGYIESNKACIDGNKQILATNQKNRKRYNILMVISIISMLVGLFVMIYVVQQSDARYKFFLEQFDTMNKYIDTRRRFLEYDRKDASENLQMSVEILRYNDSIKRRDDSLSNVKYKKTMKQ